MKVKIYNVAADGNCFYRCIARIVKEDIHIAAALEIDLDNHDEEYIIKQIRQFVSRSIIKDSLAHQIIQNLINVFKESSFIEENYPILSFVDVEKTLNENIIAIAYAIQDTCVMASSVELEIISQRLSEIDTDTSLVILSQDLYISKVDLEDKWLRELFKLIRKIDCSRMAILVNENNIHYKYIKIDNSIVNYTKEIDTNIEALMNEPSEESE